MSVPQDFNQDPKSYIKSLIHPSNEIYQEDVSNNFKILTIPDVNPEDLSFMKPTNQYTIPHLLQEIREKSTE